ncbi:unnamed protein product [Mucor hiemalis]
MFVGVVNLESTILTSNTGKKYRRISDPSNINNILVDQTVGQWELPPENWEEVALKIASSSSVLNRANKTSHFNKHFLDARYVELTKSIVDMVKQGMVCASPYEVCHLTSFFWCIGNY